MALRCITAVATALTTVWAAAPALAQPLPGLSSPKTGIIFYTENDDWPPDTGTDKDYTNGFRLTIDRNSDSFRLQRWPLFRWVPAHPSCDVAISPDTMCTSSAFHFGQQFYTPDDISIAELIPDDRPYAGWLYVGGTWRAGSNKKAVISDVYLGFTGEASLGQEVQAGWHRVVKATKPEGWEHQIGTRLGVVVAHSRHWAVYDKLVGAGHRVFEIAPFVGGNVGNIMIDAYAGGRVKVGWNITRDWTHTSIGPVAATSDVAREGPFEIFLSVDGRARAIGYNVFLDAADLHDLDRRNTGAEIALGTGLRIGRFMMTYRVAKISKEYSQALHDHHEFKALRFMWVMR
jgi:lipid A 3-O-deacylase